MTQEDIVAIIGGGRLGTALARGLRGSGFPNASLFIAQRNESKRTPLLEKGFQVVPSITDFSGIDFVLLAVKPADIQKVLQDIAHSARPETVIISGAVGIPGYRLLKELGPDPQYPVMRPMFSIFAESNQEIIPVFPCNPAAEVALELPRVQALFECLGVPKIVMDENIMEMSGWDLSTFSGVIISQMLRRRLLQVPAEDVSFTEELLIAGVDNLARYLKAAHEGKQPLSVALDELSTRIATPGGRNETMLRFLEYSGFWQILADGRDHFAAHRMPSDPLDP